MLTILLVQPFGSILCKHCNCEIASQDTDRVIQYYLECEQEECVAKRNLEVEKER